MLTEYSECRGTIVIKHFNFLTLKDNHDRACRTDIPYELQKMQYCDDIRVYVNGLDMHVHIYVRNKSI